MQVCARCGSIRRRTESCLTCLLMGLDAYQLEREEVKRKTDSSVSDSSEFETRQERGRSEGRGGSELSRHSSVLTWQRTILGCVMLHNVPRSATWRLLHIPIMDYASAKSPLRMRIASDASQRQLFKKRFLCFFHLAQTHVVDARLYVFFH